MSIRNIIILILVVILIVLFYRNRGNFNIYKLEGKVTMVNNCSNNTGDLADKIRIKAKLHYTSGTPDSFNEGNIAAAVVNPNTREATYSLSQGNNVRATKWVIESITRNALTDICEPIPCEEDDENCENRTTNAFEISIPRGTTDVTKNFTFECRCFAEDPPPPPDPTNPPDPSPAPEPTIQPTEQPQ